METETLTNLLAQVRRLADVEAFTARYTDAAITEWLNKGLVAYRELIGGGASRVLRTIADATATAAQDYSAEAYARILAVGMIDDDGKTWYRLEEATSSSDLARGSEAYSGTAHGRPVLWTYDGTSLYWYPGTDRSRAMRVMGEPDHPILVSGSDTLQSLVPRGTEYVVTFAAMKVCVKDGNQEQYAMLSNEFAKCETSIKNRVRDFTGGTPRRRDTRSERAVDTGSSAKAWIWPPYYPW